MFYCRYCKKQNAEYYPSCCYLRMNSIFLKEMELKTITCIESVNEYYTKCLIFNFSDGSKYKFKYVNKDLFIEPYNEKIPYNSNFDNRLYFLIFSTCLNLYYVYSMLSNSKE